MESDIKLEKTGAEKFLESSDALFGRAAEYMDKCEDLNNVVALSTLREVCDIVKITAMSIKALKEDSVTKKEETPVEKTKRKAKGSQITV